MGDGNQTGASRRAPLGLGEAAPWFRGEIFGGSRNFGFHFAGGRAVLMLFIGSADEPGVSEALAKVEARRLLFDGRKAVFFCVTADQADGAGSGLRPHPPGIHFFLDRDRGISRLFGAEAEDAPAACHRHWLLLDRTLRVTGCFPLGEGDAALAALEEAVDAVCDIQAPVLAIPNVFEATLCERLIALHRDQGSRSTGVMREIEGRSKEIVDTDNKVRRDHVITDPDLVGQLVLRLKLRLLPMVERAFQFQATYVERALIGCYEAEAGGHFRAHRDNTGPATAHRGFAVTINLNAKDYEGGDLVFPEFGGRTYRAPTGGAIVFSCGLLHRVLPVTSGRRYAYLPFLYDETGARIREENMRRQSSG